MDELFLEFDTEAIGIASLAQVHRARLRSGKEVAVKIQHRNIEAYAALDIQTVMTLTRWIKRIFPKFEFGKMCQCQLCLVYSDWLAEEIQFNLPQELNFLQEAQNSARATDMLRHLRFLKVPQVYWATKRVVCMEYCPGCRVDNAKQLDVWNIDNRQVASGITKIFSEMIFLHGFVHCDPHLVNPFQADIAMTFFKGNMLLRQSADGDNPQNFEIVLLDHGLYRQYDDTFRLAYASLWKALINFDEQQIRSISQDLGGVAAYKLFACMLTARSWEGVQSLSSKPSRTKEELDKMVVEAQTIFTQITEVLARVPRPLLLLLKVNDMLRNADAVLLRTEEIKPMTRSKSMDELALTKGEIEPGELNRAILREIAGDDMAESAAALATGSGSNAMTFSIMGAYCGLAIHRNNIRQSSWYTFARWYSWWENICKIRVRLLAYQMYSSILH